MKTDLFQSWGHWWVFQICWHIECSTFAASSFRRWNSSAGILSFPLALFVVMLPKAHLTSHSRMSGCRWVITPLWLSGSFSLHCFPLFLCIVHLRRLSYLSLVFSGTLHSDGYIFPFAFLSLLFSAICKVSSDNHFDFLHFFSLDMVLIAASCTVLQTFVRNSLGTLVYQI